METILEQIEEKLSGVFDGVFYGIADIGNGKPWNYVVFSRDTTGKSANGTGRTRRYMAAVTRENYVPEEDVQAAVDAVCSIPGMRLSGDIEYAYAMRPGSSRVVEQAIITFAKAEKS